jgi:hypothetical protein
MWFHFISTGELDIVPPGVITGLVDKITFPWVAVFGRTNAVAPGGIPAHTALPFRDIVTRGTGVPTADR